MLRISNFWNETGQADVPLLPRLAKSWALAVVEKTVLKTARVGETRVRLTPTPSLLQFHGCAWPPDPLLDKPAKVGLAEESPKKNKKEATNYAQLLAKRRSLGSTPSYLSP